MTNLDREDRNHHGIATQHAQGPLCWLHAIVSNRFDDHPSFPQYHGPSGTLPSSCTVIGVFTLCLRSRPWHDLRAVQDMRIQTYTTQYLVGYLLTYMHYDDNS
jgi:hypothetical protein